MPFHGPDFPVDHEQLPIVHVGDKRARVVFASPSRLDVIVPAGLTAGGLIPVRCGSPRETPRPLRSPRTFATGLHQVDNPVVRSRRKPVRHLQRHAGPAGAGVDLPGAAERHARDVLVWRRQSDVDGDRRRWPDLYVEPLRRDRLPVDAGRIGGALRHGSGRRVRSGVFVGRHAVCRRSFGHDLQRGPQRAARRRSRRCRPALPRSTSPSAANAPCTSTGPTLSPYDVVYRIDEQGTVGHPQPGVRPAAGSRIRCGRHLVRRGSACGRAAGCIGWGQASRNSCSPGPALSASLSTRTADSSCATNDSAYRLPPMH